SITLADYPVLRNLELFLRVPGSRNENQRVDPGRTDPQVFSTLGIAGFGLKAAGEVVRGLSLGGLIDATIPGAINGSNGHLDATSATYAFLATLDTRRLHPRLPYRFP